MKCCLLMLPLLCCSKLFAQHFQTKADKISTVKFINLSGHVSIEGSVKDEISIDYYPDGLPGKAAADNTGAGLDLQRQGNTYLFNGVLPVGTLGRYVIRLPEKLQLNYQSDGHTLHATIVSYKGDIDINMPKDITLNGVSGGIVIETVGGNVTVKSTAIHKHKPVSIITETGAVHFSIPTGTNAELKLGSAMGTVHAFLQSRKGKVRMDGKQFNTKLGKGGPEIHIQSLSGDIHLEQF